MMLEKGFHDKDIQALKNKKQYKHAVREGIPDKNRRDVVL